MRKPRTNILLLTTIFVLVGLVGQAWLARESVATTLINSAPATVSSPAVVFERTPLAPDALASAEVLAAYLPAMLPQPLSDDANVLVTEMCDLQLMAEGADITLSSSQWSAFATVVLRFQAIRHDHEAQIANSKEIVPGRYQVEIPVYAAAGDELRGQFFQELHVALGEPAAREVRAKLGALLERRFAGFGISVQTLDVIVPPAAEPNDILLTRMVSYWNSVEGSDRLTTRREVHFPVVEDPTGDSWSALLAKVGIAHAENGPARDPQWL